MEKAMVLKKRNSQDFPAAGLRWNIPLNKGLQQVKVIARNGKTVITDSIQFQYQTEKWSKPAKMLLEKTGEENGVVTMQVTLLDEKGVPCLDATNWIRFGLAGDGKLIDNQGTSTGSRFVQAYNGRAIIRVQTNKGQSVISAKSEGLKTVFKDI
jgi:beta-galactosidase